MVSASPLPNLQYESCSWVDLSDSRLWLRLSFRAAAPLTTEHLNLLRPIFSRALNDSLVFPDERIVEMEEPGSTNLSCLDSGWTLVCEALKQASLDRQAGAADWRDSELASRIGDALIDVLATPAEEPSRIQLGRASAPPPLSHPEPAAADCLECPESRCRRPVVVGARRCAACETEIHPFPVVCPDGKERNLVRADLRPRSCACGTRLDVPMLLGRLAHPEVFLETAERLRDYRTFRMEVGTRAGERRFELESDGGLLEVVEVCDRPGAVLIEEHEAHPELPAIVRLPTQVLRQGEFRYAVYRPTTALPLTADRGSQALVISLMKWLGRVIRSGHRAVGIGRDDLEWNLEGKVRLRTLDRLTRRAKAHSGTSAAISSTYDEERMAIARIVYDVMSNGTLGDARPEPEKIPSLRIWDPQCAVGMWGPLRAVLTGDLVERVPPREELTGGTGKASEVGRKANGVQEDDLMVTWPVLVLADGVTQSGWGDRAAHLVVQAVAGERMPEVGPDEAEAELTRRINRANQLIGRELLNDLDAARAAGQLIDPMSSTVVAAYRGAEFVSVVSLGDSRAYLCRADSAIEPLTVDHDGIWHAIAVEGRRWEEASVAEDANHLTRWVGQFERSRDRPDEIDPSAPIDIESQCHVVRFRPCPGDILMLCSDGVHDFLSDAIIESILRQTDAPQTLAEALVRAACDAQRVRGDNATVIVARIAGSPRDVRSGPGT